jgi:hypothetical protein
MSKLSLRAKKQKSRLARLLFFGSESLTRTIIQSNCVGFTAIPDQMNRKKFFESVAKQHFQKISWFGLEYKML